VIPTRQDIEQAAHRIAGRVRLTPVIETEMAGHPVTLKLECLQVTGSFKPRGAFNCVLRAEPLPASGLVTASGGNHGAAVAYVGSCLGVPVEVFVPEASAEIKRKRIRSFGAEVLVEGAQYADAAEAAQRRQAETGALMVPAYDHHETVAGQGTLGRELGKQVPGLDTVLVAVGGGGLVGGIAAWFDRRVKVVAVEPMTAPTLNAALSAGRPVDVEVSGVAADSLGSKRIGSLPFEIATRAVAESLLVSDEDIRSAMAFLWEHLRVISEPGGAAAAAALLSGVYRPAPGERVAVLVCGANTDVTGF